MYAGPNIERDGLVFGYDTGANPSSNFDHNSEQRRYFKGKPTTNYGPTSFGDWGTEYTAERIATGNTFRGQPTYNCRTVVGVSYQGIDTTISGLRTAAGASGTVTMSCMVRNNNATAYNMYAYIGHDFGSTRLIPANSDWIKVEWTVNQSSMNNDYVEFRPYTNNASIYLEMTMPMVEVNVSNSSPFTTGTRSVSGSLLDLTKSTTIDVSNVSFDSDGLPTFDGTDDYINLGTGLLDLQNNSFSIEAIVKWDGGSTDTFFGYSETGATQKSIHWRIYDTGLLRFDFYSNSINSSTGAIVANTWYHLLVTYNASTDTCTCYRNGVLLMQGSVGPYLGVDANSTCTVGNWINTQYFGGQLPVLKCYNRALTAQEIQQNYRAYKNRFNI